VRSEQDTPSGQLPTPPDPPKDRVSKDCVFSAIVKEAGEFYRQMIAVASAFLGGSLLFVEKIASSPRWWSIPLLAVSWLFLIASIVLILLVRRGNLESGGLAINDEHDEAKRVEKRVRFLGDAAILALAAGIVALVAFGLVNYPGGKQMADPKPAQAVTYESLKRSAIPFSGTKPPPLVNQTTQPPPATPSQGSSAGGSGQQQTGK
jgi:hypothetical protein